MDDERILEDVCDRLTQHAQIDASDIEVEVEQGEVTLKGTVENRRMKRMADKFPGGPTPSGPAGH